MSIKDQYLGGRSLKASTFIAERLGKKHYGGEFQGQAQQVIINISSEIARQNEYKGEGGDGNSNFNIKSVKINGSSTNIDASSVADRTGSPQI